VTASRNHTAPPVESGAHSAGGVQGGVLTAAVVTAAAVTSIVAARETVRAVARGGAGRTDVTAPTWTARKRKARTEGNRMPKVRSRHVIG